MKNDVNHYYYRLLELRVLPNRARMIKAEIQRALDGEHAPEAAAIMAVIDAGDEPSPVLLEDALQSYCRATGWIAGLQ